MIEGMHFIACGIASIFVVYIAYCVLCFSLVFDGESFSDGKLRLKFLLNGLFPVALITVLCFYLIPSAKGLIEIIGCTSISCLLLFWGFYRLFKDNA